MTLPRLKALNRYWREHPPIHLSVQMLTGYQYKKAKKLDNKGLYELLALAGHAGLQVKNVSK